LAPHPDALLEVLVALKPEFLPLRAKAEGEKEAVKRAKELAADKNPGQFVFDSIPAPSAVLEPPSIVSRRQIVIPPSTFYNTSSSSSSSYVATVTQRETSQTWYGTRVLGKVKMTSTELPTHSASEMMLVQQTSNLNSTSRGNACGCHRSRRS